MILVLGRLVAVIFAIALSPAPLPAQEAEWLAFYPSVARIQGKLIKIQKYGKPSYGENPEKDETVEVAILILKSPVRIKANPASSVNNQSLANISFVQIIFPAEMAKTHGQYFDQEIVLAGNLVRGHKGEHFTDVVMEVKAINPTGKPLY